MLMIRGIFPSPPCFSALRFRGWVKLLALPLQFLGVIHEVVDEANVLRGDKPEADALLSLGGAGGGA